MLLFPPDSSLSRSITSAYTPPKAPCPRWVNDNDMYMQTYQPIGKEQIQEEMVLIQQALVSKKNKQVICIEIT